MTRPRINRAQLGHVQRLTRLLGSPHQELTPSERDEKQDLIDKWTDEPEEADHDE